MPWDGSEAEWDLGGASSGPNKNKILVRQVPGSKRRAPWWKGMGSEGGLSLVVNTCSATACLRVAERRCAVDWPSRAHEARKISLPAKTVNRQCQ